MKFSLNSKIIFGFSMMTILIVVTGLSGSLLIRTMNQKGAYYNILLNENEITNQLNSTMLLLDGSVSGYILTGNKKKVDDFYYRLANAKKLVSQAESEINARQIQTIIVKLRLYLTEIENSFTFLVNIDHADILRDPEALKKTEIIDTAFLYVKNYLEIASLSMKSKSDKLKIEQQKHSQNSYSFLAILLGVEILIVLVTFFVFIKVILNPIRGLQLLLKNIINSMPSILIGVDGNCNVTQWNNNAEINTGIKEEDAYGRLITEVYPPIADEMSKIDESIQTRQIRRKLNKKEENVAGIRHQNITIYPLEADKAGGAVIRIDDVSKEYELEEQLNQSRKMDAIGQLAGGVAHDFNNMLSGIIGASELLQIRLKQDELSMKLLGLVIESADRAAGLTQKLLEFSRKKHPESLVIELHDILKDTVSLLKNTLDKNIKISLDFEAESSKVLGDPTQLQNIFINLAINASHSMPGGGEISLLTSNIYLDDVFCRESTFTISAGHYIEVEVLDGGCGIPEENLKKIFEPFFTTKKQGAGTGLGLSSVLGTVQNHNGAISVYSEIGSGTSFRIFLPLTSGDAQEVKKSNQIIPGSGCILMVDDESVMRTVAKAILEELGYEVLLAEDGKKGLDLYKAERQKIDLIILDMLMPVMNGKQCFEEMLKVDPAVKVILSSGFSKEEDVHEMKEKGLCNFIRKPFRRSTLSQVVHEVMSSS